MERISAPGTIAGWSADQGLTPPLGEHMVVLIAGDYQLEVMPIMTATPGVSWVLAGVGGGDMLPINDLGLSINHALHPWSRWSEGGVGWDRTKEID